MSIFKKSLLILFVAILAFSIMPIRLYAEDTVEPGTTEESEFDKLGSKTVDKNKIDLDEKHKETTVTLQLPSAEYKKRLDVVFVIDTSTSIGNSSYDFTPYVSNLFSSLIEKNPGLIINVSVVKYTGYAVDGIEICSDGEMSGLIEYSDDVSDLVTEAIMAPSKKDFDKGKYPDWTGHTIPGGGSNIHSGLILADEILSNDTKTDDMNKYVILLSDAKSYIWNSKDNEPLSYYLQYRAKKNTIYANGIPAMSQVAGAYSKEQSTAASNPPFSPYANLPDTPSHPDLLVYKPASNGYVDEKYYEKLHNMTGDIKDELSSTETPYDAPAYYTLYYFQQLDESDPHYSTESSNYDTSGTVSAKTISNTNDYFTNGTHKALYGTYYLYTPTENSVWEDIKYMTINPYKVVENDGVYSYTDEYDPDFYMYHATPIEKGLYQAGHYWKDELAEKYNVAAVMQYDTGSGSGTHIAGSFGEWMIKNSPYGAHLISSDADDPDKEVEKMFEDLDNSMSYVVNTGVVTDEIEDQFTLIVPDSGSPFTITVNGEAISVTEEETNKWYFGDPVDEVYPYVVEYDETGNMFKWYINVPVKNDEPITLSYDLLIDKDENVPSGTYPTNKSAVLEYTNTEGKEGEYGFEKPEVTYTVLGKYVIRYFTQELDDLESFVEEERTAERTGKVGENATIQEADIKEFEGFTFDDTVEGTVTSAPIQRGENNITYLDLYYTRNKYVVTYEYTGTTPADASELPEPAKYYYGEKVTVADNATADGYVFSGWSRKGEFEMPADNVVIQGSFKVKGPDTGDATDITSWMIPVIIMNVMGIAVTTVFRKRYINI